MTEAHVISGTGALDTIIHTFAPKLVEIWSGDEALVGMLIEQPGRVGIAWAPRDRVLQGLTERALAERDTERRGRYDRVIAALTRHRSQGKVAVVIAGWGDLASVEVEADDLRLGRRLTSWLAGSA